MFQNKDMVENSQTHSRNFNLKESTITIERLPNDILKRIFAYLDLYILHKIGIFVSKQWYKAILGKEFNPDNSLILEKNLSHDILRQHADLLKQANWPESLIEGNVNAMPLSNTSNETPLEILNNQKSNFMPMFKQHISHERKEVNFSLVNELGRTRLHIAVFEGQIEDTIKLLESGYSVNHKDYNGCTPLSLAAQKGHLEIVKILIDYGAAINLSDSSQQTPIYKSTSNKHLEVTKLLLIHGANVLDTISLETCKNFDSIRDILKPNALNISESYLGISFDGYGFKLEFLKKLALELNRYEKIKYINFRGCDLDFYYGQSSYDVGYSNLFVTEQFSKDISQFIKLNLSVNAIDLSSNMTLGKDFKFLIDTLLLHKNIKSINFQSIGKVDKINEDELINFISKKSILEHINLSNNNLQVKHIECLAEMMINNTNITQLEFKDNPGCNDENAGDYIRLINSYLRRNSILKAAIATDKLVYLDLSGTSLTDSILRLNESNDNFETHVAKMLFEVLIKNPNIKIIDVSDNALNSKGFIYLISILREIKYNQNGLKKLELIKFNSNVIDLESDKKSNINESSISINKNKSDKSYRAIDLEEFIRDLEQYESKYVKIDLSQNFIANDNILLFKLPYILSNTEKYSTSIFDATNKIDRDQWLVCVSCYKKGGAIGHTVLSIEGMYENGQCFAERADLTLGVSKTGSISSSTGLSGKNGKLTINIKSYEKKEEQKLYFRTKNYMKCAVYDRKLVEKLRGIIREDQISVEDKFKYEYFGSRYIERNGCEIRLINNNKLTSAQLLAIKNKQEIIIVRVGALYNVFYQTRRSDEIAKMIIDNSEFKEMLDKQQFVNSFLVKNDNNLLFSFIYNEVESKGGYAYKDEKKSVNCLGWIQDILYRSEMELNLNTKAFRPVAAVQEIPEKETSKCSIQ